MTDGQRTCRQCGINHIEPGIEVDGEPLCWVDDDLCSGCHDALQTALERDAARYRFIRNRQIRDVDIASGGVFGGQPANSNILNGEDLDRAVDADMGLDAQTLEPLEQRLAACLAEAIDTPLLMLKEPDGWIDLEIRLGHFNPDISHRAAELLEEAGQ